MALFFKYSEKLFKLESVKLKSKITLWQSKFCNFLALLTYAVLAQNCSAVGHLFWESVRPASGCLGHPDSVTES